MVNIRPWPGDGALRWSRQLALGTDALREQSRALSEKAFCSLGRRVVEAYAGLMFEMDVVREAPIPEGPKVIVANHPTTTDPFLITTIVPEQMSILISETLFKVPVFGSYLRRAGHVPVVCANERAALQKARALLAGGRTVTVFPEGAISPPEGGLHRPHTGAVRLALGAGVPIVAVGIHLQQERIQFIETEIEGKTEVGTWYVSGPYAMTVGRPLRLTGDVEDWATVRAASQEVMQHITRLATQSARRM